MAFTQPEKTFCILEFAKTESWTVFQRAFCGAFLKGHQKRGPNQDDMVNLRWMGVCAELKERAAPQLHMIRLKEYAMSSSVASVNQSEEAVWNFSLQQQLFGVSQRDDCTLQATVSPTVAGH